MKSVYLVSGVRTAIGDGGLKDLPPSEMASHVAAEALRRAKLDPAEIGHVVFGQVIPTTPADAYIAPVAAITAGVPEETHPRAGRLAQPPLP